MKLFLLLTLVGVSMAAHHLHGKAPAVARFNMNGIRGHVVFDQNGSVLNIMSNLTGLSGTVGMQVRQLPVFPGQSQSPCARTGNVFNPTSSQSAPLGDISARLSINVPNGIGQWSDTGGLTQFGKNGVVGHSLVLRRNNMFLACANIQQGRPTMPSCGSMGMDNRHQTLQATFRGRVSGTVILRRLMNSHDNHTSLFRKLYYTDDTASSSTGHIWHVHMKPIGRKTWPCAGATIGAVFLGLGNALTIGRSPVDSATSGVDDVDDVPDFSELAGKAVAIHANNASREIIACADLKMVKPRRYVADLGNSQSVTVEQQGPLDSTSVQSNAGSDVMSVSVNKFPVPSNGACDSTGAQFNPYKRTTPSNKDMTPDKYPTGDLTDKLGSGGNSMMLGNRHICDDNLPLFGSNSVAGRSVVVTYKNGAKKCATLKASSVGGKELRAKATFVNQQGGNVIGTIYLKQYQYSDTDFGETEIDTSGMINAGGAATLNHNYHVHVNRKGYQQNSSACGSNFAGGHYNPSNVAYSTSSASQYQMYCGPDNQLRCELGDTSMKSGRLNLTNSAKHSQDSWMPLSGPQSVMGRSFVIHNPNAGAPRYACANIIPATARDIQVGFKKSALNGQAFNANDFNNRVIATASSSQGMSVLYTSATEDTSSGCVYASAAVDGPNADAVANNLNSANLGPYSQDSSCIAFASQAGSGASQIIFSTITLLFAAVLALIMA